MLLHLLACTPESAPVVPPVAPAWDAAADPILCAPGGDAPLLDAALADADMDRAELGYADDEWTDWGDYVENPFVLSWFTTVHHDPEQVPCFAGQAQTDIDVALASAHPVASAIGAFAARVDWPTLAAPVVHDTTFADALGRLPGGAGEPDDLEADLAAALAPVVVAIADAVDLRAAMDAVASTYDTRMVAQLYSRGAGLILSSGAAVPDLTDADQYAWFADWYVSADGPRAFADAARRVAFAVEDADLGRFEGLDHAWVYTTTAGAIRVSPGSDDTHGEDEGALLLHLELGGDDVYTGGAGATLDKDNPVSVLVDLGGADRYGYVEVPDDDDVEGTLVSDADGRARASGHFISASETGRQGSGRYGIGLLLDLGGADDTYASLRMSQGFGSMGVGVLYDDDGNDSYAGEAGVQGAGVFGLGLLLDGGGDDVHRAWAYAQGFGYVGSGGLLAGAGDGADTYWSDPGSSFGGVTLYASPQLPNGEGNSSFTLGAGFGLRGDSYGIWLAGGLGMVRDGGGDDAYTGGVFSVGTGYWEGTGLVADAGGDDTYDALYYAQGGAAHFALAILVDGGGDDQHNTTFAPYYMMLGAGHDYSVGVLIDEAGDDTVVVPGLALGASNCQGRGVYVDNDGSDTYLVSSTYSTGLGNHSGECEARSSYTGSNALFLDSGGDADAWTWPEGDTRAPADDTSFGIAWAGTSDEHGGAVDGDGETGFHAAY